MVQDFSLSNAELWGWIADVVLNTDCLAEQHITIEKKEAILNFLWDNWLYLTERSIRLIEKMTIIMKEYPHTFKSVWEIDFLK
jgi:tRNA isopentenyl-2-thiomethyl-A-37 hydroxylase MiaE